MDSLRRHRTPRWLNARLRLSRLTIPQWIALMATAIVGIGLYLWLASLPLPRSWATAGFYLRLAVVGPLSGLLGVLFYALADDRREPVIRQAVFYLLRPHQYDQGAVRAGLQRPRRRRRDASCRPYNRE